MIVAVIMVSGWKCVCRVSVSPLNLVCALVLWRPGLRLLIGKFYQFFMELPVCDTIMAGYYSLTFLFHIVNLVIMPRHQHLLNPKSD